MILAVGVGGLLLYFASRKASAAPAATATGGNLSTDPGLLQLPSTVQPGLPVTYQVAVPAPTATQVQQAATGWAALTPVQGPGQGWVNFPSGSQAAASLLEWRMDTQGNYFVSWAGQVFVVGSEDAYGNWPAMTVVT